jgi:1-acyl-sn-glycerol-3-phosphate acyltransferase
MSRWLGAIAFPFHAFFMKRYFRIEVSGGENIPSSGPFIIAPTHRSRWDPFMLYCAVRGRILYFMTSHEEVVGLQGWLMRRMGAFPIDVRRPSPSMIRCCREMLELGEALVIFPEGNLFYYAPGEVHPLKPGVAWLALGCQKGSKLPDLPILPVRLVYEHRELRPGSRATIRVGEPISVAAYADLPTKEAVRELTSALQKALGDEVNETSTADSLRELSSHRRSAWLSRGCRELSPSFPRSTHGAADV